MCHLDIQHPTPKKRYKTKASALGAQSVNGVRRLSREEKLLGSVAKACFHHPDAQGEVDSQWPKDFVDATCGFCLLGMFLQCCWEEPLDGRS